MSYIWEYNKPGSENSSNFDRIQQFFLGFHDKQVFIKNRIIDNNGNIDQNAQVHDSKSTLTELEIKGITFHYKEMEKGISKSISPNKIEYDDVRNQLIFYSSITPNLVIILEGEPPKLLKLKSVILSVEGNSLFIKERDGRTVVEVPIDEDIKNQIKSLFT